MHNPGVDAGRVTNIFYCNETSHENITKYGWRHNDIDPDWYKDYTPDNKSVPLLSLCMGVNQ
jgi:hypothetical protein